MPVLPKDRIWKNNSRVSNSWASSTPKCAQLAAAAAVGAARVGHRLGLVRLAVLLAPVRQARLAVPKALAVARVAQIAHAWPEIHQPAPERTPRRRAVDLA